MTTIREFSITGLAGRPGKIRQVLDPKINIFWGLNGTGKTTLLKILDAALNNTTAQLVDLPFTSAEVSFFSEAHGIEFVRSIERSSLQPTTVDDDPDHEWEIFHDPEHDGRVSYRIQKTPESSIWKTVALSGHADDASLKEPYKHRYLPISRMLEPVEGERVSLSESADERFVRRVSQVWSRYNAKSLAEVRDIQQLGLAEILAILFGGKAQASGPDALGGTDSEKETEPDDAFDIVSSFLAGQQITLPLGKRDFTARYEHSDQHRHVVSRIRSITKQVDQVLAPQRELQAVVDEMYIGNKHLVLSRRIGRRNIQVRIDTESISLAALSSGEKQLLQILLETLAVEESVIMIDEPELSLHPDWQKRLIGSMRRVNSTGQFLLATHSPELMIDVADECVFEL
jgi:energy-coupling factor transporter ATP-binding protein EcfA2